MNRTIFLVLLAVVFVIVIIGFYYFATSASSLTKHTITVIHESIIHGMSGLGAIAIAVFIFRIESLENRSENLEETTLNFISQTFSWSYPEWTQSVEEDIKNKTLTSRYYANLPSETERLISDEKKRQQRRLEEALCIHTNIKQTVAQMRKDVFYSIIFLILPVMLSLLLLMVVDLLDIFWDFFFVSAIILIASLGASFLIKILLESTVKESCM